MGATASSVSQPIVVVPVDPKIEKSACPVRSVDKKVEEKSACPVRSVNKNVDSCPIKEKSSSDKAYKNESIFNVYSQKMDPTNNMPATANQQPSQDQTIPLPIERQSSTIPKGGTDNDTWLYPSPQMFWNALVRKQKTEGVSEGDVETVIAIHNNMNENTWNQVIQWENLHTIEGPGKEPKLLRFIGRPDEFSPKARLKMLFGHPEPFDRHDWVVDRGGREVRYIIDYYHDESQIKKDEHPKHFQDSTSLKSIQVDVRPALDSPLAVFDRVFQMPLEQIKGKTQYAPPSFFPAKQMIVAEDAKTTLINTQWDTIQTTCEVHKLKLQNCQTDAECGAASVALQKCMAGIVCPSVAAAFDQCVLARPQDMTKTSAAYTDITKCLELFTIDSQKILEKALKK